MIWVHSKRQVRTFHAKCVYIEPNKLRFFFLTAKSLEYCEYGEPVWEKKGNRKRKCIQVFRNIILVVIISQTSTHGSGYESHHTFRILPFQWRHIWFGSLYFIFLDGNVNVTLQQLEALYRIDTANVMNILLCPGVYILCLFSTTNMCFTILFENEPLPFFFTAFFSALFHCSAKKKECRLP